jgi:hypothetical protein
MELDGSLPFPQKSAFGLILSHFSPFFRSVPLFLRSVHRHPTLYVRGCPKWFLLFCFSDQYFEYISLPLLLAT